MQGQTGVHKADTGRSAYFRKRQECLVQVQSGVDRQIGRSAYRRKRQECIVRVKARVHKAGIRRSA